MFIEPYNNNNANAWNEFVAISRNATFLLNRNYMDYHSDRFPDASLLIYDQHKHLVALFPATINDGVVSSHAGLTYAGLLLGHSKPNALQVTEIFPKILDYYRALGCHTLIYKSIPYIYTKYPAQEDLYALYLANAKVDQVLISSVIDLTCHLPFNMGARRHVKHAQREGITVAESDRFDIFWDMLSLRLKERYDAHPVHTLDEILLLQQRFPDNIKLWVAIDVDNTIIAGTVLFLSGGVVKAQYIASSQRGRLINAVDLLFYDIATYYKSQGYHYVDLGPSCEDKGHKLNEGLITQKSGYGARGVVYTSFKIDLQK